MNSARVTLPMPESMSSEQRAVFDAVVSGPRGALIGPLRAALHNPELADRWQKFGELLRYQTTLPRRLNELAIIVTARRWNSELEWVVHAEAGLKAGLPTRVVDDIRDGEVPAFEDDETAEVYAFAREIQLTGQVSERTYESIKSRWGERGVVELTAVIGYYTMVSMTLNAHQLPLPDDMEASLIPEGTSRPQTLSDIPQAPLGAARSGAAE